MPATYEPIATTTLSSAAANITFSSITGSYTDLRLVVFVRTDTSGTGRAFDLQFNADTGANYSHTRVRGAGFNTITSSRATSQNYLRAGNIAGSTAPADVFSLVTIDINNYAGSTNKTVLSQSNNNQSSTENDVIITCGLWQNTNAITSIKIYNAAAENLVAGTSATLYGILKA